jgi:hypothetical protein
MFNARDEIGVVNPRNKLQTVARCTSQAKLRSLRRIGPIHSFCEISRHAAQL